MDSMKEYDKPQTFGERGKDSKWDINLPFRFLSIELKEQSRGLDDGLCAIDISHRVGEDFDTIIPTNLRLYAEALLNICVRGTPNEGGVVTNIGQNGNLALRIVPYRPMNIRCKERGTAPPPMICRKILDLMPADGTERRFGPPGDPSIEIPLPKRFMTPEMRCALAVSTNAGTDVLDWYKIWAAALAVEVLCVEVRGAEGMVSGLGEHFGMLEL
ncbi:hypothetical protein ACLMJK_007495 [Lecanora helva]